MNLALIFAGGVGMRMHSKDRPKQFLSMHGKPIIIYTLEVFENHPEIDGIVIACVEDWIPHLRKEIERYHIRKVRSVVPGGETGQLSIYHTLAEAERLSDGEKTAVLIHDGVRPMITEKTVTDNLAAVREFGSCITSVRVTETVLVADIDGSIRDIPERENSRLARAPQSFWLDDVLSVHRRAMAEGRTDFIDTCSMMQHYGRRLHLVDGPRENIKITTPDDFYIMRAMLDAKENAQVFGFDEE